MLAKILVIVGGCVATVVAMFILGKMADGKDNKADTHSEQKD